MSEPTKRVVSLSSKSLDRVAQWCEDNPASPLAKHYLRLCEAVGLFSEDSASAVTDELALKFTLKNGDWWPHYLIVRSGLYAAFDERDKFGRLLLNGMKKGKL